MNRKWLLVGSKASMKLLRSEECWWLGPSVFFVAPGFDKKQRECGEKLREETSYIVRSLIFIWITFGDLASSYLTRGRTIWRDMLISQYHACWVRATVELVMHRIGWMYLSYKRIWSCWSALIFAFARFHCQRLQWPISFFQWLEVDDMKKAFKKKNMQKSCTAAHRQCCKGPTQPFPIWRVGSPKQNPCGPCAQLKPPRSPKCQLDSSCRLV